MNTLIAFSIDRRIALRQFHSLFVPPSEVAAGEAVFPAPEDWDGSLESLVMVDGHAIFDPALALSSARELTTESIRAAARAVLERLDIRHNARLGELRIDRTDPVRIEAYYTTLLEQQQVRDSSNAAQSAAMSAATPSTVWAVFDALNLYSAPVGQLGKNITKYAFIKRLNLSHSEKQIPYIAGLQAELQALSMVNLPSVGVELQKLVAAGILTQSRVDEVVHAPIVWIELETNF